MLPLVIMAVVVVQVPAQELSIMPEEAADATDAVVDAIMVMATDDKDEVDAMQIIDKSYTPVPDGDKDEFEQMQTFMYHVLNNTILVPGSKAILDTHREFGNAQELS
jgi:hypothetical protein